MSSFCNAKATHIFSAKNIDVFAISQDRYFLMSGYLTTSLSFEQMGPGGPGVSAFDQIQLRNVHRYWLSA